MDEKRKSTGITRQSKHKVKANSVNGHHILVLEDHLLLSSLGKLLLDHHLLLRRENQLPSKLIHIHWLLFSLLLRLLFSNLVLLCHEMLLFLMVGGQASGKQKLSLFHMTSTTFVTHHLIVVSPNIEGA